MIKLLSDLYIKTKKEISNIKNIDFSEDDWNWYYENGVKKRLEDLKPSESFVIKSYIHTFRADALLKQTQEKYLEYL